VVSVYVQIDGSQRVYGVVSGETWSVDINTNDYGDGDKDIITYLTHS